VNPSSAAHASASGRRPFFRVVPVVAGIFLLISAAILAAPVAARTGDDFAGLKERLEKDGYDAKLLDAVYSQPEIHFDVKSVSLFFIHSEARLNYDQFTTPQRIQTARQYMQQHMQELAAAQKAYGVDKEVITAIILVETKLGTYLGASRIINTLSTMAAISDPALREKLWKAIPESRRLSRQAFLKKAKRKSKWAYTELKALLTHASREGIDPAAIRGSYAGAMGIAQFMPSNVLSLAQDGNNDGRIDLFNHADAIMSVASYLSHYGWRPGIDRKAAYRVLLRYNYSKPYANTVLKIADLLKNAKKS